MLNKAYLIKSLAQRTTCVCTYSPNLLAVNHRGIQKLCMYLCIAYKGLFGKINNRKIKVYKKLLFCSSELHLSICMEYCSRNAVICFMRLLRLLVTTRRSFDNITITLHSFILKQIPSEPRSFLYFQYAIQFSSLSIANPKERLTPGAVPCSSSLFSLARPYK